MKFDRVQVSQFAVRGQPYILTLPIEPLFLRRVVRFDVPSLMPWLMGWGPPPAEAEPVYEPVRTERVLLIHPDDVPPLPLEVV